MKKLLLLFSVFVCLFANAQSVVVPVNSTHFVNNVTEIKRLNVADNEIVQLLGHYSNGDCDPYYMQYSIGSSATDDGMSIIRPNNGKGRFLLYGNKFTFKQLGITPSSDNSAGWLSAITLSNLHLWTVVIDKNSTYYIDATLSTANIKDNITVKGEDFYTSVVKCKAYTTMGKSMFKADTARNVLFENFTIDGNQIYTTAGLINAGSNVKDSVGYGVKMYHADTVVFNKMHYKNLGSYAAVYFYVGKKNKFNNSQWDSVGGAAIATDYGHDIHSCEINGNQSDYFGMFKSWSSAVHKRQNGNDFAVLGGQGWHLIGNVWKNKIHRRWFVGEYRMYGDDFVMTDNVIDGDGINSMGITFSEYFDTGEKLLNPIFERNRQYNILNDVHTAADSTGGIADYIASNLMEINGCINFSFRYNHLPMAHFTINSSDYVYIENNDFYSIGSNGANESGGGILFTLGSASGDTTKHTYIRENTGVFSEIELVRTTPGGADVDGLYFEHNIFTAQTAYGLVVAELSPGAHNPKNISFSDNIIIGTVTTAAFFTNNTGTAITMDAYRNNLALTNINSTSTLFYDNGHTSPVINKCASTFSDGYYTCGGGGSGTDTSHYSDVNTGLKRTVTGTTVKDYNDTTIISTRLWRQKAVDSINALLALKAPLASPALTGTPTAPTPSTGDNSTKVPTTAFVAAAIANAIAAVNPAVAVQAATTANVSGYTYNNGASGIGATLTQNSAAVVVIDGYTLGLNERVLFKNQSTTANNGVYYISTLGTGLIPAVFTRVLDYDQPSDMNNTGAIPVVNGTLNAATSWLQTSTVNTVGTDAVTYTQFSYNPSTVLQSVKTSKSITGTSTGTDSVRLVNDTIATAKNVIYIGDSTGTRKWQPSYPLVLDTTISGDTSLIVFIKSQKKFKNIAYSAGAGGGGGGGGSGILEDLSFTGTGLANTGTTWNGTRGSGVDWDNYGVCNKSLGASTSGYIEWQYVSSSYEQTMLAFSTNNTSNNYATSPYYTAACYIYSATPYYLNGSNSPSSAGSVSNSDWLRIVRDVAGSSLKLQKSSTHDWTSPTDLATFTYTAAQLYVKINMNANGATYYLAHPGGFNLQ